MALVETAGAAWVTSATGTVASGTITPAAGDLLVALIACGNGTGGTNTAISVANTTLGGTVSGWTQLAGVLASSSGGGAWVFIADAGSAPTAGTITATLTGTAVDIGVIVRRFAGALPVASQNGATATLAASGVRTLSVTPAATGSQIVGADGQDGTHNFIANAATSIYAPTNGGQGDRFCAIEGTALTTAGIAQVLGFTSAVTQNGLVLAEILAALADRRLRVRAQQPGPARARLVPRLPGRRGIAPVLHRPG